MRAVLIAMLVACGSDQSAEDELLEIQVEANETKQCPFNVWQDANGNHVPICAAACVAKPEPAIVPPAGSSCIGAPERGHAIVPYSGIVGRCYRTLEFANGMSYFAMRWEWCNGCAGEEYTICRE